jgi:hypothetical protein
MRSHGKFACSLRSGFTQLPTQFVTKMINGNHATLAPKCPQPSAARRKKVAVYNLETDTRQFSMGSLALLARRHDFVGDVLPYRRIVFIRRQFSANIFECRRHVGESRLVKLQHRDHVAAVGNGTDTISAVAKASSVRGLSQRKMFWSILGGAPENETIVIQ